MKKIEKNKNQRAMIIAGVVITLSMGCVALGYRETEPAKTLPAQVDEEMTSYAKALMEDHIPLDESLELLSEKLDKTDNLYKDFYVSLFIEKLGKRAEKLNTSFRMFKDDIQYYVGEDISKINTKLETDDAVISALIQELETPYFLILGNDLSEASIGVNYDYIIESYADVVTPDLNNKMELMAFSNSYRYFDVKDGHPDFNNMYIRYKKVRDMQVRKENKDNMYLMSEAYDTYFGFLGIKNMGMNTSDNKYNELALKKMEKFIASNKNEDGKNLEQILESIKSEGKYGEKTEALAVKILDEKFKEYVELMKKELGK